MFFTLIHLINMDNTPIHTSNMEKMARTATKTRMRILAKANGPRRRHRGRRGNPGRSNRHVFTNKDMRM